MMRVDAGGVELEVDDTGGDGPAVLLLHGWPDSGALWRHQVPALAEAGFRCIVPDVRGFGASDKPAEVEAYAIPALLGDVVAVLDACDVPRAHVVGHDWGAALAWSVGSLLPERVDHLVAMSVGHPTSFRTAGVAQREKSWYMLLFQFRDVAERWLSMDGWANFRDWVRHPAHEQVVAALSEEGALTASLGIYRANVAPESLVTEPFPLPAVRAPTMGIWSTGDIALTEQQMVASSEHVDGPWRYERIEGPGHWMQLEVPDRINALLVDFLPSP